MSGIYIPNVCLPGDGDFELWIAVKKDGSFTYNISSKWKDGDQKAIPAADVAPVRHGRWETDTCHVYCSVCDKYADEKSDFCPHCGARMDGGEP